MAMRSILLSLPLLLTMVACGSESATALGAPDEIASERPTAQLETGSGLLIRLTGTEDGMVSGQSGCKITYTATNGTKRNVKFLSMEARPVLSTDNPVVRSAVEARGKIAVYPGKLSRGETDERSIGVAAARCEQIGGLEFSTLLCGFDDNLSCSGQVKFENQTALTIEME